MDVYEIAFISFYYTITLAGTQYAKGKINAK